MHKYIETEKKRSIGKKKNINKNEFFLGHPNRF